MPTTHIHVAACGKGAELLRAKHYGLRLCAERRTENNDVIIVMERRRQYMAIVMLLTPHSGHRIRFIHHLNLNFNQTIQNRTKAEHDWLTVFFVSHTFCCCLRKYINFVRKSKIAVV